MQIEDIVLKAKMFSICSDTFFIYILYMEELSV